MTSRRSSEIRGSGSAGAGECVWRGVLVAALLLIVGGPVLARSTGGGALAEWRTKVDPWVLDNVEPFGVVEFLVSLDKQADLHAAESLSSKESKADLVYRRLTETARRTQGPVIEELERLGVEYRAYWVTNTIWVRGDRKSMEALARRGDVAHLYANPEVRLSEPLVGVEMLRKASQGIEDSIEHTRAVSELWRNGFTGEGIVIGGQDTGYEWGHPALESSYRGWDGRSADHNYNWHDAIHEGSSVCGVDSAEPCDGGGHGTHTMGTMVGDDGGENRIGMAPGARWIGCRNMNDQGIGTVATYTECFQWFVAPTNLKGKRPDPSLAPDVINNSWSCPPDEGCTDPGMLRAVVENARAAGILVVASAGNEGPGCSTVDSPIAIYDSVFSVGATNLADGITDFSSRGPVAADGSGRLKPDIAAPGSGIRSSVPGGGYESSNGTSMAAPHVAGMAALVLSAAECLQGKPAQVERHLLVSALPRTAAALCGGEASGQVPNNTYGHGALRGVLPACPGDGRIAGSTSRLDTGKVLCRNKSGKGKAKIDRDGLQAWNCMAEGLEAEAGDRVVLVVNGTTSGAGSVAGEIAGLELQQVICKNKSSKDAVRIPLGGASSFDCEAEGLTIRDGEKIKLTVVGTAEANSH